jgi:hypothetical protein
MRTRVILLSLAILFIGYNEGHAQKGVAKVSRWETIDDYAFGFDSQDDIKAFTHKLLEPAKNDLESVRLIFSWIASHVSYDLKGYLAGNYGNNSAEAVFKQRTAVCEGFSQLFEKMCVLADIEVKTLHGYAKGYSYVDKQTFRDTNHAWNVVKYKGNWLLMDVTWASYKTNEEDATRPEPLFDDFWFDTEPAAFVFTHYPVFKEWQLLMKPIVLSQFEKLPCLNSAWFRMGFTGNECLETALYDIDNIAFPDCYPVEFGFTIKRSPLRRVIKSNVAVQFDILPAEGVVLQIYNNEKRYIANNENGSFYFDFVPEAGRVDIAVSSVDNPFLYWIAMSYEVKDE